MVLDGLVSNIALKCRIDISLILQSGLSMVVPGKVMRQTNENNVRLHFIAYRTSAFFIPEAATPEEVVLKQKVITAEIKGQTIENLTTPIKYNVLNIEVTV
jgi:hypothetical protein